MKISCYTKGHRSYSFRAKPSCAYIFSLANSPITRRIGFQQEMLDSVRHPKPSLQGTLLNITTPIIKFLKLISSKMPISIEILETDQPLSSSTSFITICEVTPLMDFSPFDVQNKRHISFLIILVCIDIRPQYRNSFNFTSFT